MGSDLACCLFCKCLSRMFVCVCFVCVCVCAHVCLKGVEGEERECGERGSGLTCHCVSLSNLSPLYKSGGVGRGGGSSSVIVSLSSSSPLYRDRVVVRGGG